VELYNNTGSLVRLSGISLYYADGVRGTGVTEDTAWKSIALNGSIPAGGSYLVLGPRQSPTAARLQIENNYGDINNTNFTLGNRAFKVALIRGRGVLNAANPFDMNGNGAKAAGYIDMVGSVNNPTAANPDNIFGFEFAPTRNSASEAARRKNLNDSDNNSLDFIAARYGTGSGSLSDKQVQEQRPRNSSAGAWDPFAGQQPPPPSVVINQAAGTGLNPNGAIQYSFVELYNQTDISVNISGWALQYTENGSDWAKLNLAGSIPAKHSYLIRMNGGMDVENTKLYIYAADRDWDIVISNSSFKFALTNHQNLLVKNNPAVEDGVVDFVSATNSVKPDFWWGEGPAAKYSKQQSARRVNFVNTRNNQNDFSSVDYRTFTGMSDSGLLAERPRSLGDGAWLAGNTALPFWYNTWLAGRPPLIDGKITFSRSAGLYSASFTLTTTHTTSATNSVVRYTINGDDPTSASPAFPTGGLSIADRTTTFDGTEFAKKSGTTGTNSQTGDFNFTSNQFGNIFRGTVVKAQVFNGTGQAVSEIFVNSYFVSPTALTRYGNLSVISVSVPGNYFFDTNTGIYQMGPYPWVVNGHYSYPEYGDPTGTYPETLYVYNFDNDWERPAYVEMFDSSSGYSRVIDQGMGVRIHGGGSRHNPQKSLRFYARTGNIDAPEMGNGVTLPVINGKSAVNYDLFRGTAKDINGNAITSFQRFVLRGHANDATGALMRDPLGSIISNNLALDTLAYRPVVVFLNGEFWGLYEIRERYDDRYLAAHYGGNRSNYDILENPSHVIMGETQGTPESLQYYKDTVAYLNGKITQFGGMNNDNAYNEVLKYVDEKSLIDYVIIETFGNHGDWINRANWRKRRMGNNQRIWRYTGTPTSLPGQDGKYRWMLYDMDSAFESFRMSGKNDAPHPQNSSLLYFAMAERNIEEYGRNEPNGSLYFFHKLIQNDKFKEKFFNRYMDLVNTFFRRSYIAESGRLIDQIAGDIAPVVNEQRARWPYTRSDWQGFINNIKVWFTDRADRSGTFVTYELAQYTNSNQTADISFVVDGGNGFIILNGMEVKEGHPGPTNYNSWSATYFVGYTQVIQAGAFPGRVFSKFTVKNNTTGYEYDHLNPVLNLSVLAGGHVVTAYYTN